MDLNFDESFEDYRWAWTIREIELSGLGDLGGVTEDLAGSGYWGEETESSDVETKDLGDMGIEPDMITDMLSAYIREVRVVVWWGENEDSVDQIEIVFR